MGRGWRDTEKTRTFVSQLGIGVTIPEPEAFAKEYVKISQDLRKKFGFKYATPFFSSTCLRDHLNIFEAIDFARQLVSGIQDHIESVHCSYIALPTSDTTYVEVGGIKCAKNRIPTIKFIDSLGPMFSYLTALRYVWTYKNTDFDDLEMHIDAFRSRHTKGWNIVKKAAPIKIFYKGDECNPFISCANIIAFLVDETLTIKRLKLSPDEIKSALEPYKFDKTVHFFSSRNVHHCAWKIDQMINISDHLAKPIVFLAIDRFAADTQEQEDDTPDEQAEGRLQKPGTSIRQTKIYQAASSYAYQKNGCMKLFSTQEDMGIIKSGDVFIPAGPNSAKISKTLQDMASIEVLTGREAINLIKKTSNSIAN